MKGLEGGPFQVASGGILDRGSKHPKGGSPYLDGCPGTEVRING